MKYPALLRRTDTALAYMEQLNNHFSFELNNAFYAELNDYPANRWFTKFFDSPDCRILIRNIFAGRNYANFQIVLLPGKRKAIRKHIKIMKSFRIISLHFLTGMLRYRSGEVWLQFHSAKRRGNNNMAEQDTYLYKSTFQGRKGFLTSSLSNVISQPWTVFPLIYRR